MPFDPEALKEYFIALIGERDRRLETIIAERDQQYKILFAERDRLYEERESRSKEALRIAYEATEKEREQTQRAFESHKAASNEWQGTFRDFSSKTFSRDEINTKLETLDAKRESLEKALGGRCVALADAANLSSAALSKEIQDLRETKITLVGISRGWMLAVGAIITLLGLAFAYYK